MSSLEPLREKISGVRAQFDSGIPFTPEQLDWIVRTLELQYNLIYASDEYINELNVDALRRSIEIHELKETVAHNG